MKKFTGLIGQNLGNRGNAGIIFGQDVQFFPGLELPGIGRYDKGGIIGIHPLEKAVMCLTEPVTGDAFERGKIVFHSLQNLLESGTHAGRCRIV